MKKLEDTKKIIPGSVIRIYRHGFGYSMLTVHENNEAYLALAGRDDIFRAIGDGNDVEAYLWVEDIASYEFTLRCIGRISIGPCILFFEHTDKIVRSEERKCLAVEVEIPIRFFATDPGKGEGGITTEEIVQHDGTIILLTDREATIRIGADIRGSRLLKGTAEIGGESLEILGIVEVVNEPKGIYSVIFSGISERTRNSIQDFIFMNYREEGKG